MGASPVTLLASDGQEVTLAGGYYPLIFDHRLSDQAARNQEEDMMKNHAGAILRTTKPADGFAQQRNETTSQLPPLLSTGVWFQHIDNVSRYISHARILRDLNKITRHPDFSATFKKKAGESHYKEVRNWLQFNANPNRRQLLEPAAKVVDKFRNLATGLILGFKVAVGIKQRASIINAANALGRGKAARGWKWIGEGFSHVNYRTSVMGLSHTESWDNILRKSKYMKTRAGDVELAISEMKQKIDPLVKKFKIGDREFTGNDVRDFAFQWIRMNDRATVSVIWVGAYNQYIQELANKADSAEVQDRKAVAYADGIIQDTQPSTLKAELSGLQRTESALKIFTMFMTFTLKYGNRIMSQLRAKKAGQLTNKELISFAVQEMALAPWLAMTISTVLVMGRPPELDELLSEPFFAMLSWIPVIRDLSGVLKYRTDPGASPTFGEPLSRGIRAAQTLAKAVEGDKNFWDLAWDTARLVEVYYGVSPTNFIKDLGRILENINA